MEHGLTLCATRNLAIAGSRSCAGLVQLCKSAPQVPGICSAAQRQAKVRPARRESPVAGDALGACLEAFEDWQATGTTAMKAFCPAQAAEASLLLPRVAEVEFQEARALHGCSMRELFKLKSNLASLVAKPMSYRAPQPTFYHTS